MTEADPVPAGPSPAVPAATVVPLRDDGDGVEVLMLRRSRRGAFGGHWVFPGGQVDPGDLPGHPAAGDEVSAARRAAVREAREEAGLELEEDGLVTLSFWLPPAETPRRFSTWFFVARVEPGADVAVDLGEIREHRWLTPAAAMKAAESGEMEVAPPTFTTLWWVERHRTVEEALREAGSRAPERFESRFVVGGEGRPLVTMWEGDAGYHDGDVARPGPRRRMTMGPGKWRVEMVT